MVGAEAAWVRSLLFLAGLALFGLMEWRNPYRTATVSKGRRWLINMGLTAINSAILAVVFAGAPLAVAQYVSANNLGLLNQIQAPYWVKLLAAVAFLDFMLYIWHLLNHEVPLLWRFHRVHHTDLNMDVSTATRFHLGELCASACIKIGLIYLIGADVAMVLVFESALVFCAQFHHSCLKVSPALEAWLWPLFVPPSMHRIHHSVKIKERDTNYGTIFSIWDRVMGTMLKKVDQGSIRIGVGGHFDKGKLNLHHLLVMPVARYVR